MTFNYYRQLIISTSNSLDDLKKRLSNDLALIQDHVNSVNLNSIIELEQSLVAMNQIVDSLIIECDELEFQLDNKYLIGDFFNE